ncbi:MAG: hypothetical protein KF900_10040 [Bacteroidetes bacterium]|nr:hypothetical protein [Bacteroidota bacterium]
MGQNTNAKWCFGFGAGLDFTTNPPTTFSNAIGVYEGCSSIADACGNLLMYTEGATVYNKQHQVMANGTGLLGNNTPQQSSVIIKQPGNTNLYYIFTVQGANGGAGLNYSVVDMSLAVGLGSVTVKNVPLYSAPCNEALAATMHANNTDYFEF